MSTVATTVCAILLAFLLFLGWLVWPFLEDDPPRDDDYSGFP